MIDQIQINRRTDEHPYLKRYRGAEIFENIRLATEQFVKKGNKRPKVFLATYGNLAMRKARAGFTTNFFGCAGYEISDEYVLKDIATTVQDIKKYEASIVVICSSDEEYAQQAGELARAVKQSNKGTVVIVAGYPKELIELLKSEGVDDFIHVRVNAAETLAGYNKLFGIN